MEFLQFSIAHLLLNDKSQNFVFEFFEIRLLQTHHFCDYSHLHNIFFLKIDF